MLYKGRQIGSPRDSYELIHTFLEDVDWELFLLTLFNFLTTHWIGSQDYLIIIL